MLSPRDAAMIHILHLCSYYAGSSVYRNLIRELDNDPRVGTQSVFIPVRQSSDSGKNKLESHNVFYYYTKCLNTLTRLLYTYKQIKIAFSFLSSKKSREFIMQSNVIHAHTLYADGPLALIASKLFKKPYVVTIRGTDVNYGFKFFRLWKPLAKSILENSNHIYFVSPRHREMTENYFAKKFEFSTVLPNGVDKFWIENRVLNKKKNESDNLNAIYIGSINKNKNLKNSIKSLHRACSDRKYSFSIIGGSYEEYKSVFGPLEANFLRNVSFLGHIGDKEEVRKHLFGADLLLMPSHSETFGLTYLEAVSQCTPTIFSIGQGIDGYFEPGYVGHSCNPKNVGSITAAIEKTIKTWPTGLNFDDQKDNPVSDFSWSKVASKLITSGYTKS